MQGGDGGIGIPAFEGTQEADTHSRFLADRGKSQAVLPPQFQQLLRDRFLFMLRRGGGPFILLFALQDGHDSSRIDVLYGSQILDFPQLFQPLSGVEAIAALAASRGDQAHAFPVPQRRSTDAEHVCRLTDAKIDGGLFLSHGVIRRYFRRHVSYGQIRIYRKPYNLTELHQPTRTAHKANLSIIL